MSTETTSAAAPAAPATTMITAPATPATAAGSVAAPATATFDAATGKPVDGAAAPAAGAPGEAAKPGEGGDVVKTPEQVAADEAAAKATEEAAKPAGAPEKYETFTPPEGGALDQAVMDQFGEAARELNLPQDKAQQLIDKMAPVIAQRQAEQMSTLRTEWATQSTADTEFGGTKLTESMVSAKKALDAFGTPELTKMLNDSGIGNHPEVVRFMVRTGRAMSEDKVVTGGTPASTPGIRTAAETLYPSSSLKK